MIRDQILDTMYNNLDKKIRQTGIEKREIARRKGITPETLSRHCSGKIHLTRKDADEYAQILGCTSPEILYPTEPLPLLAHWRIRNKTQPSGKQLPGIDKYYMSLECTTKEHHGGEYKVKPNGELAIPFNKDFVPKVYLHSTYRASETGVVAYDFTNDQLSMTGNVITPWWTPEKIDTIDMKCWGKSVDPDSFMMPSYCMTEDRKVLWGYIYPEPKFGLYTVHVPESTSFNLIKTYTGQRLKYSCPILGSVYNRKLRGVQIDYN